jgi:hypothetical protein
MILYCCTDLIFATKIRSTAESLNVPTRGIQSDDDLTPFADASADEPAEGETCVTAIMIDLELGDAAMQLIDHARATLPNAQLIAFGSHVAKSVLDQAKARGAHQVLPRSAFTDRLPELLQNTAD